MPQSFIHLHSGPDMCFLLVACYSLLVACFSDSESFYHFLFMLNVSYDAETGVTVTSSAGSAMVVTPDIIVNRGVVHAIDTVI